MIEALIVAAGLAFVVIMGWFAYSITGDYLSLKEYEEEDEFKALASQHQAAKPAAKPAAPVVPPKPPCTCAEDIAEELVGGDNNA